MIIKNRPGLTNPQIAMKVMINVQNCPKKLQILLICPNFYPFNKITQISNPELEALHWTAQSHLGEPN